MRIALFSWMCTPSSFKTVRDNSFEVFPHPRTLERMHEQRCRTGRTKSVCKLRDCMLAMARENNWEASASLIEVVEGETLTSLEAYGAGLVPFELEEVGLSDTGFVVTRPSE
jgi:hypothetical protein